MSAYRDPPATGVALRMAKMDAGEINGAGARRNREELTAMILHHGDEFAVQPRADDKRPEGYEGRHHRGSVVAHERETEERDVPRPGRDEDATQDEMARASTSTVTRVIVMRSGAKVPRGELLPGTLISRASELEFPLDDSLTPRERPAKQAPRASWPYVMSGTICRCVPP
ncbi:MAG TPA: hypothetical protein VNF05_02475 [Acidimicrobiales bacterium]|nr:hypothetical protein [Acidimicrobiales bacterium]